MARRPKIRITLIDRKGPCPCHRGHRVGDSFDFDRDRGQICPMVMHVAFPYIDILRYGGRSPAGPAEGDGGILLPRCGYDQRIQNRAHRRGQAGKMTGLKKA